MRLHQFWVTVQASNANEVIRKIVAAPKRLLEFQCIGEMLEEFKPREIRRLLVSTYEMRYEIKGESLIVLKIWHTRENRDVF